MENKRMQGKKNRAAGQRFEKRVRADLEKKGWIVDRWTNNLEEIPDEKIISPIKAGMLGKTRREMAEQRGYKTFKLIPAKPKFVFNPVIKRRIPIGMSSGFPDFIAISEKWHLIKSLKQLDNSIPKGLKVVFGIEAKSNGKLDQEEKEKCRWYLDNNIFSSILIAKKGEKRGSIIYEEFVQ